MEDLNGLRNDPLTPRSARKKQNSSPMVTPRANIEFSRELKQVLHERNVLTKRTKKKVFEVLDEIEVTQTTQGLQRKRENAIFEIMMSEKNYVNQLSLIINFFMKPIKEKKLLNNADYEILFGNIQTIYNVNQTLLKEFNKGSLNVAKAFLCIAPYFKLYSTYALGFKSTLSVLEKARIRNTAFYNFMEMQETRPEVQNKLSALLITPIQRIPRYRLLLHQLSGFTPQSSPDYKIIHESLQKIEEVAEHINKVVEDQENIQRLIEVQRLFKNNEPSIILPGRFLIKEGILLQFEKKVGPSEKLYVILLNDIILFSKMKSNSMKSCSLKCKMIFPLNKCSIRENLEKGCFQINCQADDVVLYDREVNVTKEWIKCITEAIQNCIEKKKTLRKDSSARRPVKRKDLNEYSDVGLSPGLPLKRKRQTIDEEIKGNKHILSSRRSIRSPTTPVQNSILSDQCPIYLESSTANYERIHQSTPKMETDLFVFGRDHPNTSFTFKLSSMITNIGNSVINMFRFRRQT